MLDDVVMTCSVTSSSSCTSTSVLDGGSVPTISLHAAADDRRETSDDDTADNRLIVDETVDEDDTESSKRVPRAGHDRKKHPSYRYAIM